jgi:hypothetical protein
MNHTLLKIAATVLHLPLMMGVGQSHAQRGGAGGTGGGGGCTVPASFTSRWFVGQSGNTCGGGSACTDGAKLDTNIDSISANNAVQTTDADRPVFHTAQINGQPAATYSGAQWLQFTEFLGSTTPFTMYAVINPTASVGNNAFVGSWNNNANPEWRLNTDFGQELLSAQVDSIGSGATAITGWTGVVVMYTPDTGNWTFEICSGGTCSLDNNGTHSLTFGHGIDAIGTGSGLFDAFQGKIAEVGVRSGATDDTGIGSYLHCQFNL